MFRLDRMASFVNNAFNLDKLGHVRSLLFLCSKVFAVQIIYYVAILSAYHDKFWFLRTLVVNRSSHDALVVLVNS